MIISRTPFRVSFFGGGTDYDVWYREHGGVILSTTINHYCYLCCRILPPFFQHKYRMTWTKIEEVPHYSELQHPVVRAVLRYLDIQHGLEIYHQGDLPARSGLGTSSAFTVCLLQALYELRGVIPDKQCLAREAIYVERDLLHEYVGVQDQIAVSYGGFNQIIIKEDGSFHVLPITLAAQRLQELENHLLLFFTGVSRTSSQIAQAQIEAIPGKTHLMQRMMQITHEAIKILLSAADLTEFSALLHEAWLLKRQLSSRISPHFIDEIYAHAMAHGALGGKVLGAGGGGFMLFFVRPEDKPKLCHALKDLLLVPFKFEQQGSEIIFCNNQNEDQNVSQALGHAQSYSNNRLERIK